MPANISESQLKGLRIGWEIAKNKKLPPKPCLVCGEDVYYKKSTENRAKYCSISCKHLSQKGKPLEVKREKTGKYFMCEACAEAFYRTPSEVKRNRIRFCSIECRRVSSENRDIGYMPKSIMGAGNSQWKGGITTIGGYVYKKAYDHPNKNSNGYVAEHRLLVEEMLNRYLDRTEQVHHKNGIKDDNRIENLEIVLNTTHYGNVKCPYCEGKFLIK